MIRYNIYTKMDVLLYKEYIQNYTIKFFERDWNEYLWYMEYGSLDGYYD